jgi:hypothetical protein
LENPHRSRNAFSAFPVRRRSLDPITECGFKPFYFNFLAAESRNWSTGLSLPNKNDRIWETKTGKTLINERRKELLEFWGRKNSGQTGTGLEEWQHETIARNIESMLRDADDWAEMKSFEKDASSFNGKQKKRFERYKES